MNAIIKSGLRWVPSHVGVLLVGAAVIWFLVAVPRGGTISKLEASLANARSAVAQAQESGRQLARTNKLLRSQLETANSNVAGQRKIIGSLERTVKKESFALEQTRSDLAGVAATVTNTGAGIESEARDIKRLVDALFAVYNKG